MTNLRHIAVGVALAVALGLVLLVTRLGGGDDDGAGRVVLVTHDSFVISDDVKRAFERSSGLRLRILQTGDAGEMLAKALLTAGDPQGDVLFGVDSNLLSRALEGELFEPYESAGLRNVPKRYVLDPEHRALPVDHGEVCLNYDKAWFRDLGADLQLSMAVLANPIFKDTLVVENPATSTPGLAFLLATIARYGENDWQDYWRRLRENNVLVVDGWEEAYRVRFSGAAGSEGDRPVVVSYASSPPAEVIFREPRPRAAPTAVIADSCFSQIEFAGVLRGAANEDGARKLVDFLLSRRFQEDVPLSMFVFPVHRRATLPPEFVRFAVVPENPLELPPQQIHANRDRWVKEWTRIVLR
jgi:thiamine transport system substrate-binding protein